MNLFNRTKSILNPEIAKKETFLILGIGSGGSRLTEEVTRFGVGKVILVDLPNEKLEEHNICRHILGYSSLGQLKNHAVAKHIKNINPEIEVECHNFDVSKDIGILKELIQKSTQVHLCTDNEQSKNAVNSVLLNYKVPATFAGVYDGGVGGEVGVILPGKACYGCISTFINRKVNDTREVVTDYNNPNQPEFKTTAALNIDIAQISLLQARLALLLIENKNFSEAWNYILFGNKKVDGLFKRLCDNYFWSIPKNPDCLICKPTELSDEDILFKSINIIKEATVTGRRL